MWVFEEDILSRPSRYYLTDYRLRLPLPPDNEALAKRHFELGKTKNLGMALSAFATCQAGLLCTFIVPTDKEDAQHLMIDPKTIRFALTIDPLPKVKIIQSRLLWKLLNRLPWLEKGSHMAYLMSKANVRRM